MPGKSRKDGALASAWDRTRTALSVVAAATILAACATQLGDGAPTPQPGEQTAANASLGEGQVRVGLILPLSGQGNAGVAAQSMKNAAEMALAEFKSPNIQLLVKDDGGTGQGAQGAAQQVISEGAEIIIGPLFAQSVSAVGQVARARNIPVIAFSTDASVAARGIYLLSFLPETDVRRIVDFAVSRGKRSFAALLPDNAYGTVVEAAFQQEVSRRGGRVLALEKYPLDANRMAEAARRVGQAEESGRQHFHSRRYRRRASSRAVACSQRCEPKARAIARHRLVGRPADFLDCGTRRWLVCGAGIDRLPQFLGTLSRPLWARSGAHGNARV